MATPLPAGTCGSLGAVADVPAPVAPAGPRPWWAPAPEPQLPPISARRAYTEVLLVYGAFFLAGILAAALLLAGRYNNPFSNGSWSDYSPETIDLVAQTGLAVTVVLLLATRRGVSTQALGLTLPRQADGRLAAAQALRIVAWGMFALVFGGFINALLQTGHLPTSKPDAPELIFAAADSLNAGIVEELVVLAFVVVTLRQARRPWWEVTLVALVLRGAYHIYYGPGVFGILVWAVLFYWLYLRTRSLIILMVCHAAWDTVGFLSQRWAAVAYVGVIAVVAIWIAAPITWLAERSNRPLSWSAGQTYPGGPQLWAGWQGGPPGSHGPPGWVGSQEPAGPASSQGPATAGSQGPAAAPGWVGSQEPAGSQGWAPPGWQPDPAGVHHWRWWDGQRWTEHVSGP